MDVDHGGSPPLSVLKFASPEFHSDTVPWDLVHRVCFDPGFREKASFRAGGIHQYHGPPLAEAGSCVVESGHAWPNGISSNRPYIRSNRAPVKFRQVGQIWLKLGKPWLKLAKCGRKLAEFDQIPPQF